MMSRGIDANNAVLRGVQTLPSLKVLERKLDEVAAIASGIDHGNLVELWRRAEQASGADGYPASSMGTGVQTQSADTSTESAALRGLPGPAPDEDDGGGPDPDPRPEMPDAVLEALAEVAAEVSEVHGLMRRVQRRLVFATATGESHRGRVAEGSDCVACGEFASGAPNDRLRSGFDNACYTAWVRFRQGRNEEQGALRAQFIRARRAQLAEEKKTG